MNSKILSSFVILLFMWVHFLQQSTECKGLNNWTTPSSITAVLTFALD